MSVSWWLLPIGVRVLCVLLVIVGFFLSIRAAAYDGPWLLGVLLMLAALGILSAAAGRMERVLSEAEHGTR